MVAREVAIVFHMVPLNLLLGARFSCQLTHPTIFEISTPIQLWNVQSDREWYACIQLPIFHINNASTVLLLD